jgi:hypothetical protein
LKWIEAVVLSLGFFATAATADPIRVTETDNSISVKTDALSAVIAKKGVVSGIRGGTFIDKRTSAHDLGFGLHVQDWLLAPGWREGNSYIRDPKLHGHLAKHIVEGPQLCVGAKQVAAKVVRGEDFVAVVLSYQYTKAESGYEAGSTWEQTILFQPSTRYVLTSERIKSRNSVDDLFYRLDMPGHIRHKGQDNFEQVYLSYRDSMIPTSAFKDDFAPDEKFFYQRDDSKIPKRMIRAYQVKLNGKPGPWLAGMTLDPAEVSEAWCNERGYVCFIEELHKRHVNAGETIGNAYVIGWFDDVPSMNDVYDRYKGSHKIVLENEAFRLEK